MITVIAAAVMELIDTFIVNVALSYRTSPAPSSALTAHSGHIIRTFGS
jgi:hypothetical protein